MAARKRKKAEEASRLILFEPKSKRAEYEYTFLISFTLEDVEKLLDLAEEAEPDKYGCVVKMGGALYENDNGFLSGKAYIRDEEEEEEPPKRSKSRRPNESSKSRSRYDDDDDDDDEPPTKARKRRTLK